MKHSAKRICMLAMLTAAACVISIIEGMIPSAPFMPPGAKAGLSNIITMFAALEVGLPAALFIAAAKALAVFAARGFTAFLMSLFGGVAAACAVFLAGRVRFFGLTGISVCGAVTHNLTQLCVAVAMTGKPAIYYAPFLILFGTAAGCITACLLKLMYKAMSKMLDFADKY